MSFIYLYSGLPPPSLHLIPLLSSIFFFLRSSSPTLLPIFFNALPPFFPTSLPCQLFDVSSSRLGPPLLSLKVCLSFRTSPSSRRMLFVTRQMRWIINFNIWLMWNHILSLKVLEVPDGGGHTKLKHQGPNTLTIQLYFLFCNKSFYICMSVSTFCPDVKHQIIQFITILHKVKQRLFKFKCLEPSNIWYFCFKIMKMVN